MRMKQPDKDKDDLGKLRHRVMYLKDALYMKSYLSANKLSNIVWWVDGSFEVHWESMGRTEAIMAMGRGAVVKNARKYNINVASSTGLELVSIDDVPGMIL